MPRNLNNSSPALVRLAGAFLLLALTAMSVAATCGDTEVVDPRYGGPTATLPPGSAVNAPAATGGTDSSRLASANTSPVATLGTTGDGAAPASGAAASVPAAAQAPIATPVPPTPAPAGTAPPATPPTNTPRPSRERPTPAPPAGQPPPASQPLSTQAAQALTLINQYRQELVGTALRPDAALNAEAAAYAKLMGDTNTFGHVGPDGSTAIGRVAASGYAGSMCGEAIAAGQATPAAALSTWRSSPEHNAIMLSTNAEAIGIGYYFAPNSTYKYYWVLVTGKAAEFCPS